VDIDHSGIRALAFVAWKIKIKLRFVVVGDLLDKIGDSAIANARERRPFVSGYPVLIMGADGKG
jgi:hypothetical protein